MGDMDALDYSTQVRRRFEIIDVLKLNNFKFSYKK